MAAIVRLARHKAPALRAVGVWALSVVRPPGAAKILIARARDKHVGVRRNAVIGLGNLRVAAGARVLRKRLFDRNPLIRSAAVRSLSLLGGRGVSGLALAVRRGDPDLKLLAVTALGRMKHRRARRLLRRCARVGEPAVRALAAGELIDDGDPAGSRAAIRLLARGNPRGARLQAAQLLGRGRTKAGERALKRALHDANANVRQAAANALAERRARKK